MCFPHVNTFNKVSLFSSLHYTSMVRFIFQPSGSFLWPSAEPFQYFHTLQEVRTPEPDTGSGSWFTSCAYRSTCLLLLRHSPCHKPRIAFTVLATALCSELMLRSFLCCCFPSLPPCRHSWRFLLPRGSLDCNKAYFAGLWPFGQTIQIAVYERSVFLIHFLPLQSLCHLQTLPKITII